MLKRRRHVPKWRLVTVAAALTCFLQGDFEEAQSHSDEALKIYDPEWDRDAKFRFTMTLRAPATLYLALRELDTWRR